MIEVFSSGGGTQSTAIALLIVQGKLPKPDLVVIADTGRECQSTWDYLEVVTHPALSKVGIEVHRVGPEWKSVPEHGRDFMNHKGNTMIVPAWTDSSGEIGKLSGFCSARWKTEAINRYLSKTCGITRSKYRKWIGFSIDEGARVQRMAASNEYAKGLIRFPLVESRLFRRDAIKLVEDAGWPTPPRSRCWMCPNQGDNEWRSLPPDEMHKAIAFEAEMQKCDPYAWLHKSCKPLAEVDFSEEPGLFDAGRYCSSGVCYV